MSTNIADTALQTAAAAETGMADAKTDGAETGDPDAAGIEKQ